MSDRTSDNPNKIKFEVTCPICKKTFTTTCPDCADENLLICDHNGEIEVVELEEYGLCWKRIKKV